MTKAELVDAVVKKAEITKVTATKVVAAVVDSITEALKKGSKVTLVGFGTFSVTKRKARKGRNPRTGQIINISATKVPKFSPSKALKDLVK